MGKKTSAIGLLLACLLFASGCSTTSVQGTVEDKYIEDFTEYTVVVKEDGTKNVHHFEIKKDEWEKLTEGDRYDSDDHASTDD